uniref:CUB domain-containing protein n=1 Tax=Anopheles dirus TaxID=7168 RepID=A0A182NIU2_9DIPT
MKSIIAIVLFVACAAHAAVTPDCVKQGPCVEQNAVPLYDADGHYYPYELGTNCMVKYYHPTDLSKCPRKTCGCGTCSSCRQQHLPYPHYPHYYGHPYSYLFGRY